MSILRQTVTQYPANFMVNRLDPCAIHVTLSIQDQSVYPLNTNPLVMPCSIRGLIQELADYEKMPDGPKISAEQLEEDGFGPHKYFHCKVAEEEGKVYFYIFFSPKFQVKMSS